MTVPDFTAPDGAGHGMSPRIPLHDLPTANPDAVGQQLPSPADETLAATHAVFNFTETSAQPPQASEGRFLRRRVIGRGGFGIVFEAVDNHLRRKVAIKIARKRNSQHNPQECVRFLEEARAAARLSHPNIVQVFDSNTDHAGRPYVVLEYIDGESLEKRIAEGRLPRDEALSIVIQAAEAIHVAHRAGLIHRDLKPANILIDHQGRPHITDFGLAVDREAQRKQANTVSGSWLYMSPEQIRGQVQYLDGRTDIWSLGVVLYKLLSGVQPFSGRNLVELRDEIEFRNPTPLRQIDDSIPLDVEQVCLRCLAKSSIDRYSSALDLANALRQCQTAPRRHIPHRVLFGIVGALAVCLMGFALSVSMWPQRAVLPDAPVKAAAEPVPGEWFHLLQRPPEFLSWSVASPNSRWDLSLEKNEVVAINNDVGLVKFVDVPPSDYEFEVTLSQSPWTGEVGVFFGLRPVVVDGVACWQTQLLKLTCDRPNSGFPAAQMVRMVLTIDHDFRSIRSTHGLASHPLLPIGRHDHTLRFSVSNGRMHQVRWGDQLLSTLWMDEFDREFVPADNYGGLGFYLNSSSVILRNPQLFVDRTLDD